MADLRHLTVHQARQLAVQAQGLGTDRPADLLGVVRRLTLLQVDLTAAVAPSAELVLWSRLGEDYRPGDLDHALVDGSLVEIQGRIRPAEDVAMFTAEMAAWPRLDWQHAAAAWVEANDDARRDVLARLADQGPLPTKDLPDTVVVPWQSGGWNNNRSLRMLLERMVERGEIAVAGRNGRETQWDLALRVYPDLPPIPLARALQQQAERRLASLGIARARSDKTMAEPHDLGPIGQTVVVDGVRGHWQVDPLQLALIDQGPWEEDSATATLLSPLDRLVFDRKRLAELFEFDYQLEMYKPAAARRWGYWAMPVLYGDRLVGKLDATADRDNGELRINALHLDRPLPRRARAAVEERIDALGRFLDLAVHRA